MIPNTPFTQSNMPTIAEVLKKLSPHVGKPVECAIQINKGIAGILMEKLAGIPQTTNILDCEDGEVKSFPLKCLKNGTYVPKETIAVTRVNNESLSVPFAESTVYKKLKCSLYLPLKRDGDNIILQTPVLHEYLPGTPIYSQLEADYNVICAYYKDTNTLSGSSSLGTFLQTRTKGKGHGTTSRAFYLRTSFVKKYVLGVSEATM